MTSFTSNTTVFRADPLLERRVTDERVPPVSGATLIKRAQRVRNAVRVSLMSGYASGGRMGRVSPAGAEEGPS